MTDKCPECGSEDIRRVYVDCMCCTASDRNPITHWQAPHCNDCNFTGYWGSSAGGDWYSSQ